MSHHNVTESYKQDTSRQTIANEAAPGISYYTPAQNPPSGTASDPQPDGSHPPLLFQPLKIRGLTLQNRIAVSPMCQYSAENGHQTAWHMAHLGGIVSRGPGLTIIEATAVVPEGRITPEDCGLWTDSQIEPIKKIVEFAHSQGQKIGIQLGHAGRKASTVAPWLSAAAVATEEVNGWPDNVWAPSAVSWGEGHADPKELSLEGIENVKKAWVASVQRALKAGVDVIEIHAAHGYLFQSFLSPAANKRTDKYGGSFENRTRLIVEIVDLTRANIPDSMPLFLRISGTEWLEEAEGFKGKPDSSWTSADTVKFAPILAEHGVDLLDVSSGGGHSLQHPHVGPGYQVPLAKAVKQSLGDKLLVGTVGSITGGKQALDILENKDGREGAAPDLIIVARPFQKNPGLVWTWAEEIGVEVNQANQIRWGFGGRKGNKKSS